jgi:hypothetical protein
MVPAGLAAHCAGAGQPGPSGEGGLAQTVSLAPGGARRQPGGRGMAADDLPTTNWRRTHAVHTCSDHLISCVWGYLLFYSREGLSYIIMMCSQAVMVCSFSPLIYAQGN